jgi:hypothetical protein
MKAAITGIKKKIRMEPSAGERKKNAADLVELYFFVLLVASIELPFGLMD